MSSKDTHHKSPDDARSLTLSVLMDLHLSQGVTLDTAIESHELRLSLLTKRDRAFFNALLFGVVRFRSHLDHVIRTLSAHPLKKIDPVVINVLRMAIFQLKFMDRVPESAAVNTSVNLVKKNRFPLWTVKFTNGILRSAARKMKDPSFPEFPSEPERYLALYHAFPEWLIRKWIGRYGLSATERLSISLNEIPPTTLRVNTLKTNRDQVMDLLFREGFEANPTLFSPDGISLRCGHDAVTGFPGYGEGLFQVQDEAAQLITRFLDPKPGETILDACAGLGGKTTHMAQVMKDQGMIVAVDKEFRRLKKLTQEKKRLGIQSIHIACLDMGRGFGNHPRRLFDKILVDAPCSGLGVIRRNPDIKWQPQKERLEPFQERQIRLLEAAAPLLKPGGVMVYAVCSIEPEENEAVIMKFLANHPSFTIEAPSEIMAQSTLIRDKRYLSTMPSPSSMDGFFGARLRAPFSIG